MLLRPVEPVSEEDLGWIMQFCRKRKLPNLILGRGSNLLIRDGGIRGVVICLAHPSFCGVEVLGRQLPQQLGRWYWQGS